MLSLLTFVTVVIFGAVGGRQTVHYYVSIPTHVTMPNRGTSSNRSCTALGALARSLPSLPAIGTSAELKRLAQSSCYSKPGKTRVPFVFPCSA